MMVMASIPTKRGRPTAYRPEFAEQARKLALLGATDAEVASFFNVSEATVNRWKTAHLEFCESIKAGKTSADANVAESLYKRAIGYSCPDTHVALYQGEAVVTELTKHYPPDTGAAFIWLKNRQPQRWRDRVEVEKSVNLNVFPPREVLDGIYARALAEAEQMEACLVGRMERLGIVIDVAAEEEA